MSDETDCNNTNNSIDDCDTMSCYLPIKKIKLTPTKNRNARSLTEKIQTQVLSNSWKFIDKNETMIAELSGGKLTLWQFLLELLMSDEYSSLIKWTDRNIGEFILIQAEEVAKLWGIRKDRNHRMNYDKLSRALRYYYQKNIIKKVHGHKFVYRFVSLVPDSIAGSASCLKALTTGNVDISSPNQPMYSVSDTEGASNDNCNPRNSSNRVSQPMSNMLRLGNKNSKKNDFNSTLTALFQAALLSLSNSNPELSSTMYANQKESEPQVRSPDPSHSSDNTLPGNRIFDVSNQNSTSIHQECICKPEIIPNSSGMFFPTSSGSESSIHMPPFDRQSMLHFSRHSINMQRLSQEILLHATSKSRFNSSMSNTLLSSVAEPINTSMDQPNHNFWLNQFAHDLYKSTTGMNIPQINIDNSNVTQSSQDDKDSSEVKVKEEKSVDSNNTTEDEDSSNLTALFQKFVKDFDNKRTMSSSSTNGDSSQQYNNYSRMNLANLIKSQLSCHSSFVWMPVPVNFAEEIMDLCFRSLKNQTS